MRYQGGKSRISKQIAEVINAVSGWEIPDSKADSVPSHAKHGGQIVCKSILWKLFCGK